MVFLVLLALPFLLVGGLFNLLWWSCEQIVMWLQSRRERRIARIEAELDRTQEQMRATIVQLSSALGADAHEARKALIRESFLASGHVPDKQ